jgi:hypothetical protein
MLSLPPTFLPCVTSGNYIRLMSATLGVIPTEINSNLTFGNVLRLAERTICSYFSSIGMKIEVHIKVQLSDTDEKYTREVADNDKFIWETNEFASFTINNFKGPEAYCERISDTLDYWGNYIEEICENTITAEQVSQIKANNLKWYYTRPIAKSALVNLAYGHLAAATAELTKGILHTKTGWDPILFPVKPPEFLEAYFQPEKTVHAVSKKWAEKSLNDFRQSAIGKKAISDFENARLA